jgi:hypothetical protein
MSYSSLGSYYEFTPHEIFPATSGVGEYYELPVAGYGEYYELPVAGYGGYGAFGADSSFFDVQTILNNVAKSDVCYGQKGLCKPPVNNGAVCAEAQPSCNFAGQQVGKDMQAALNQLGYGPIAVDGSLSWEGPYKRFLSDFGMTPGPGFGITEVGLRKMKEQLEKGAAPGPNKPVIHKKVPGGFIPEDEPVAKKEDDDKATIMIGIGVLAVAALAVGYVAARKKRSRRAGRGAPITRTTL